MKLKIWYKDGEFPEPGKGYEEFNVRAKHQHHDRILMFKGQGKSELVVDEKKTENTSTIKSIELDKVLQWKLVDEE